MRKTVAHPNAWSQTLALFTPINRDGYKFVAAAAGATIIAFMLSSGLGLLGVLATAAIAFFFRDPVRVIPIRDGLLLSPADGTVIVAGNSVPPPELGLGSEAMTTVSIFLSLLDVHVVRTPLQGRIDLSLHEPGVYHNAAAPEASRENERHNLTLVSAAGARVGLVLVAGLAARRIVTTVRPGDALVAGERIGLIRFGSRVDVYAPESPQLLVAEGQRVVAGETVLADFEAHEPSRGFRRQ